MDAIPEPASSQWDSPAAGGEARDALVSPTACAVYFALLNAARAMQFHCDHHRDPALRASLETIHQLARQAKAPWLACDAIRLLDDFDVLSDGERQCRCERLDHGIGAFCVGRLLSEWRMEGEGA